ncbi:MAG: ABC transporter ATP-binding protein [Candidatus Doudnabacteria bacterium]|nr:ABC transporter ATP-binding protein [Candidatus Doudnabacteria bacterium]
MIRVQNLIKEYGTGELVQRVLKDITLSINSGEFVSIIGPSGAGKSTLLYQISLLDQPTSGEVYIDERLTRDMGEQAKTRLRLMELGYVFQDYALLPELTALENVLLPMYMQGLTKRAAIQKAELALSRVGLLERQDAVPSKLSGGQQQRVSIARAIAHSPKILFADEPTANLDSENSQLVMESFLDIYKSGQTIIMVTHEMEYARMAKRTIELRDGRVVTDVRN